MEYNPQTEMFETEQSTWGEAEWSGEGEGEFEGEWSGESTSEVFNEAEQMELAAELLEVRDEAELDRFLGSIFKKAAQAVGQIASSPIGKALGGVLKGVAKRALPLAGTALGTFVGGPLGAQIGGGLASAAGSALGLEQQELNQEDREFEGAKQFVKVAGEALKSAAASPRAADPGTVAQRAVMAAVQQHAPGLLQPAQMGSSVRTGRPRSGRWIRKGRNLVILDC
jgi:hypothetical protein